MKQVFYFFLILCIGACDEPLSPLPTPEPDTELIVDQSPCNTCEDCDESDGIKGPKCLWKNPMSEDKELMFCIQPYVYKDIVVYVPDYDSKDHRPVYFYNKKTGKRVGEWSDYQGTSSKKVSEVYAYKNILVVIAGSRNYGIDMNTFKTKWVTKSHDLGDYEIKGIGNSIFYSGLSNDAGTIYFNRGFVESGKFEVLHQETIDPKNFKIIYSQLLPYYDGKDTLILWWKSLYDYNTYKSDNTLYCYNVSAKKMAYSVPLQEFEKNSSGFQTTTTSHKDGKMYISLHKGVYCIDIKSGATLWSAKLPARNNSQCVIGNDGNVYALTWETIHCLDSGTGTELWTLPVAESGLYLQHHNGILYFKPTGTTRLTAVDIKERKVIWSYLLKETQQSTGANKSYFSGFIIDPETNKIFANSNTSAYCFDGYAK